MGRMGEVLTFVPGAGEFGAADGITDGTIEGTAEGFDGMASNSTEMVSTWGRFEGDAEPGANFGGGGSKPASGSGAVRYAAKPSELNPDDLELGS